MHCYTQKYWANPLKWKQYTLNEHHCLKIILLVITHTSTNRHGGWLAPSSIANVFHFKIWNLVPKVLKLHYNQKVAPLSLLQDQRGYKIQVERARGWRL